MARVEIKLRTAGVLYRYAASLFFRDGGGARAPSVVRSACPLIIAREERRDAKRDRQSSRGDGKGERERRYRVGEARFKLKYGDFGERSWKR